MTSRWHIVLLLAAAVPLALLAVPSFLAGLLAYPFRWYCRRFASRVEAEYPGPYEPGTYGAAWRSLAAGLRAL